MRPLAWTAVPVALRLGAVVAASLLVVDPAPAQNRGVYPLGMSALSSGSLADSGVSYANQFLMYSRDRAKDNDGHTEPVTGTHSVAMDMNTFTWVSRTSFKAVRYAASATLPFAWNSLTSDVKGPITTGSGFADSYYLPLIVGRNGRRVDVRAQYGFLAPTGKFTAGANDNVGSGYWTQTLSFGQTARMARDQRLTVSTFEMYEVHTRQRGGDVRPGDTFDLDASILANVRSGGTARLEIGIVGYAQRQTTARTGSGVPAESSADRYAVNALGVALRLTFPKRRANVAFKYFAERANRSTFEGSSVQVVGAIAL
ncbi:MAG TPA: transporter [Gemmatimonadaceae bacterium]|nr:transporter [Gemmatimonadaceae bacterium]